MNTVYNAMSYYRGSPYGWSLDDVGLPRGYATACMTKRAMRWCEHMAETMLAAILDGSHDPETPWHMDETLDLDDPGPDKGLLPESWWVIVPAGAPHPPIPGTQPPADTLTVRRSQDSSPGPSVAPEG